MAHEFGPELEEHEKRNNKRIALLIAILALFLALSEMLGKSAQTEALSANVEASDLWAFFQAKAIRITTLRTAADTLKVDLAVVSDPSVKEGRQKLIDSWQKTIERYESDPEKRDGRKELEQRAQKAEEARDSSLTRYHHYELASAALQIGIVLASASIITSTMVLAWLGMALGLVGVALISLGFAAPQILHALLI
jgi:TPP-dependent indolepyruvate ferredoxin oxidoreductase alpha subunit